MNRTVLEETLHLKTSISGANNFIFNVAQAQTENLNGVQLLQTHLFKRPALRERQDRYKLNCELL